MGVSRDKFQQEMRALIDKYIDPSSTIEDYVDISSVLEHEVQRLDVEAEKFPDEEVDALPSVARRRRDPSTG
ncbi:hypothetical protein ACE102_47955 (plasmid) [Bradyrhizobium sp. vgs-9]|jgi:hypothetical protein|uniref:hypothetical protein n=1 Tax=Bradyrhizobium sp. vgs-9 TaxID=208389 RepID=UPI0035D4D70B